ncbi:PAS domain S-box protein [filamentous cyanobacterium LEGE 11480]|uniref:histidine kinase n=1 Tax=Romeriopsis navalis LEGE 11480 TaxID=2777977 RepID=A0A928VKR8_9CYAN|nr:PAS domain S-box protein [Romeriopsis navalis]MBE9028345.1 PAS domain S-box protein [Romeriopsis navalis LEGE 11480]
MVQNADQPGSDPSNPPCSPNQLTPHREQALLNEILELQNLVAQLQQQNQDLQATETALHERETQFQVLVENSQDLIYTHSTRGIIEYIAPSVSNVLGYDAAHFLGQSFTDFLHPEDTDRLIQIFQQMHLSGEPKLGIIMRLKHRDGRYRWLSSNLTPIIEEDGQINSYQGLARNVTERFKFEEERRKIQDHVRSTHAFLKNILNHLPDPIFVQDNQGKFVLSNEAMCELVNLPPHRVIGTFSHDILPIDVAKEFYLSTKTALETGQPQTTEVFYPHPDGTTRFVSAKRSIYTDANNYKFIIGSIRDLTDHRATEDRLKAIQLQLIRNEKMSALGMMIAGIAHEIKNPLHFIGGNLFPLEQSFTALFRYLETYDQSVTEPSADLKAVIESGEIEFLKEDLPKLIKSMNLGVERMQEIVQSLQIFARNDTDCRQIANLHEGLDSTLLILKPRLKACGERPQIEIMRDYGDLPSLECYPGQLNQVFMNLLGNAIDALEEANTQIHQRQDAETWQPTISIATQVHNGETIQILVQDNGNGLSFENQARLFKQAFTTKPIGKGTGMGMTISNQIITERHQGHIVFSSTPHIGTTFSIMLPIHLDEADNNDNNPSTDINQLR